MGCHSLLWGIILTQGSNLGLLHMRKIVLFETPGKPNCVLGSKYPSQLPQPTPSLRAREDQGGRLLRKLKTHCFSLGSLLVLGKGKQAAPCLVQTVLQALTVSRCR